MSEETRQVVSTAVEWVGLLLEVAGMGVILIGFLSALVCYAGEVVRRESTAYRSFRTRLGRAVLLSLELLVAADILRTVSIEPSMQGALVLGVIVLIRTFLSFSLEVELSGELPWRRKGKPSA